MSSDDLDRLRALAGAALLRVNGAATDAELEAARGLLVVLRNARLLPEMGGLAESLSRRYPNDAQVRRLYAQYLIEDGLLMAAIDVLAALVRRVPTRDPEHAEAKGLLGRAYKQLFVGTADKTSARARDALNNAIAIHRQVFEAEPANTWHGVNLLALLTRAQRLGLRAASDPQPAAVTRTIMAALTRVPPALHDEWYLPTMAEASLGLGDWDVVEASLRKYLANDKVTAFHINSTLRQFTELWDVEGIDARGQALADILRARLLEVSGGQILLAPAALRRASRQPLPSTGQLEAVLGAYGAKTFRWWKNGLERARAVCVVRSALGGPVGSGWLVRAASLGLEPADELLVMTNFHVVNQQGISPGITPDAAEIVFEAVDPARIFGIDRILWSSPPDRHDASVLRLSGPVHDVEPLPLAKGLPLIEDTAHVYVIGHPGGRDLAFSMQDNALIDHEGPPLGRAAIEGVCRVHYRAPTEGGSSGSPVFNASLWQVIALHHKGGKLGMPRLNGVPGTYAANEGIAIQSIVEAIRN